MTTKQPKATKAMNMIQIAKDSFEVFRGDMATEIRVSRTFTGHAGEFVYRAEFRNRILKDDFDSLKEVLSWLEKNDWV